MNDGAAWYLRNESDLLHPIWLSCSGNKEARGTEERLGGETAIPCQRKRSRARRTVFKSLNIVAVFPLSVLLTAQLSHAMCIKVR